MITISRDYLGHIWELDKNFTEQTEQYLNGLEKARHYFLDKFLSTNNEEAYNTARFILYEITGIQGYFRFVLRVDIHQDEDGNYKVKPMEI